MPQLSRRGLIAGGLSVFASRPQATWAASSLPLPQPGSRHTWATGSSNVPGEYEPDSNGQWINVATGQGFNVDAPSGAGLGYAVKEISHATSNGLLGQSVSINCPEGFSGPTKVVETKYFLGDLADFRKDPRQLAALPEGTSDANRISRLNHAAVNASFNAIRIQTKVSSGWTQYIYDLESGLALSFGSATRDVSTGGSSIAFSRLADARMVNLPGINEEYPQNFRVLRSLNYRGQTTIKVPGVDDYSEPRNISYSITRNAGPYFEAHASINGSPGDGPTLRPAGIIASFWMNPQTLQKYTQRTVLDTDPVTKVTTTALGSFGSTVAFSSEAPLSRAVFAYDTNNGILMQSEYTEMSDGTTFVRSFAFAGAQ